MVKVEGIVTPPSRPTAHPSGYLKYCILIFLTFVIMVTWESVSCSDMGVKLPNQEFEMQCLPRILVTPTHTPQKGLKRSKQEEEKEKLCVYRWWERRDRLDGQGPSACRFNVETSEKNVCLERDTQTEKKKIQSQTCLGGTRRAKNDRKGTIPCESRQKEHIQRHFHLEHLCWVIWIETL